MAGGKGKAGKDSGKSKGKVISRSARSGLQFPVGRIHRFLKQRYVCRILLFSFISENLCIKSRVLLRTLLYNFLVVLCSF